MISARHFGALALLCFAVPLVLRAEDSPPPARSRSEAISGELTLDKAVETVLRQNPEILKAIQEIERDRGQVIAVRAEALPKVRIATSYEQRDPGLIESRSSRSGGGFAAVASNALSQPAAAAGATGSTASQSTDVGARQGSSPSSFLSRDKSWRIRVEGRQVVYAGGRVRAAVESARLTEDRSYWNLRETIDRVVARVRSQFSTVLLNRALIGVQQESIELLGAQLKDQQDRFKAGAVARFNVLQAEVALSNARPELIRARNSYLISQLDLFKTLSLGAPPAGQSAPNVVGTLDPVPRSFDVSEALKLARERRPFLKARRQNILIEAEQLKIALAGYQPRFDARGEYQLRNSRLSDELDDTVNGWFYGLTGQWQFFDGLATDGRAKQARARLEAARIGYGDAVHQVDLEVQQALARLDQARETMQSQQKSVEQAVEALRLAGIRFAAGASIQLEVLDARVALTRARTTELQARADYNIALAEFDRATARDTVYDDSFRDPLISGSRKEKPENQRAPEGRRRAEAP